jgi:hypothetical protein
MIKQDKELEAVKQWNAGDKVMYQGEKGVILKVFRRTGLVNVSLIEKGLVMVYPTLLTSGWEG